jgi:hypothetical protein
MRCRYPSLFDPRESVEVWFCDASCCKGQELHRDDGPAVIHPDGTREWWEHGRKLTDVEASARVGEQLRKEFNEGTQRPVKLMRPSRIPRR